MGALSVVYHETLLDSSVVAVLYGLYAVSMMRLRCIPMTDYMEGLVIGHNTLQSDCSISVMS